MEDFDACLVLNPFFWEGSRSCTGCSTDHTCAGASTRGCGYNLGFDLDAKVCIFPTFHYANFGMCRQKQTVQIQISHFLWKAWGHWMTWPGVPCKRQEAGGFEGDLNLAGNEHIRLKLSEVFLGGHFPSFLSYFCRLRDKQYPSSRRAKTSRERQAASWCQLEFCPW